MACEQRLIAIHVHGYDADIEAFFRRLEETLEGLVQEASVLWPALEFIDDGDDDDPHP